MEGAMQDTEARSVIGFAAEVWGRRKWLGLFLFAVPMAAALSLSLSLPDLFSSTATVLVEQQMPEAYVKSSVTSEGDKRLRMIREKLLNRASLLALVTRFDLYPELRKQAPDEAVAERMRRDIVLQDITLEVIESQRHIYGRDNTFGFKVSYRGRDPETVAMVANTLAAQYVDENLHMRGRQASEATALLKKQLADIKQRHLEQERMIAGFKQRNMGELPEQMEMNLSTLGRLNQELHQNSERQMRVVDRRERLGKQLFDVNSGTIPMSPDSLPYHLEKLRTELTELQTRASAKHPDVRRVQGEIAAIEKALADTAQETKLDSSQTAALLASPDDIKRALKELDHDLKNLEGEERRLRSEIAAYQRRVERAPHHAQEFQQIERDYKMTQDLYASVLQRYEEAQLAETKEQTKYGGQMQIVDPAMPSKAPAAPSRLKLILGGLVLSFAFAVGGMMWAERRDKSFHDVDSLRAFTRVPILVRIPAIVTKWERRKNYARATLRTAASVVSLVLVVGASYYLGWENESLVWTLSESKAKPQQTR
jgi:polysaccharide biosynthesis transport protein